MIIRSSADMVDLLLFSLGQAETLGRMTTPVGVNLGTLHRHHIMFRNGNNPSEGFKNNSNKAIRERKKKKKSHRPLESRAGRKKRRRKRVCTGWIRGLGIVFGVLCIFLFLIFIIIIYFIPFLFFLWISPPN